MLASEFATDAPLFELVEQGALDLALATLPLASGPFEHRSLLRVRWVLAAPARWSLGAARRRRSSCSTSPSGRSSRRHGERAGPPLEAQLTPPATSPTSSSAPTSTTPSARSSRPASAPACCRAYGVAADDPAIATHTLDAVPLAQSIALFWHRERVLSPAAEELRAVVGELFERPDPR